MNGIRFAPRAGLGPHPITVAVGGERFTIRAARADVWLDAWAHHGVSHLAPAMLESKRDEYGWYRAASRSPDRAVAMMDASRSIFAQAAGLADWWVADRIAVESVNWAGVGGELYTQGLRPAEVPLAIWIACAYRTIMLSVPKDDRAAIEGAIMLPPAGYDTEELPALEDIFTP